MRREIASLWRNVWYGNKANCNDKNFEGFFVICQVWNGNGGILPWTSYLDYPKMPTDSDGLLVIADRFTKTACFIPAKQTFSLDKLAKLYVERIISQYGTLVSIVSDRDPHFTTKFWPKL